MAPLPKRRWSSYRQSKKRRSLKIKLPTLLTCSNCGKSTLPHRVCAFCGYYKGKEIVKSKNKTPQKRGEKKVVSGKANKSSLMLRNKPSLMLRNKKTATRKKI